MAASHRFRLQTISIKERVRVKFAIGLLMFCTVCTSAGVAMPKCNQEYLKEIITIYKIKNNIEARWEAVYPALTRDIKGCLVNNLYNKFKISVVTDEIILFEGEKYRQYSDGFFLAPASDHGYASVFKSVAPDIDSAVPVKYLKLAFSVYPNGGVNILNVFAMVYGSKSAPVFIEIGDLSERTSPIKCKACHLKSNNSHLRFDNYRKKSFFIR